MGRETRVIRLRKYRLQSSSLKIRQLWLRFVKKSRSFSISVTKSSSINKICTAISATMSILVSASASAYVQGADTREGTGKLKIVKDRGRRELLLSSAVAVAQVTDSRTELLKKYLKKSEDNKAKNDKERLDSYYKRNYKDYFGVLEGSLKQKKEQLSESEKGILEWLEKNK